MEKRIIRRSCRKSLETGMCRSDTSIQIVKLMHAQACLPSDIFHSVFQHQHIPWGTPAFDVLWSGVIQYENSTTAAQWHLDDTYLCSLLHLNKTQSTCASMECCYSHTDSLRLPLLIYLHNRIC